MMLSSRTVSVRPAVSMRPVKASRMVVVRAAGQPEVKSATAADAIKEAEVACKDGSASECAAAWDVVEEISAATNKKKISAKANSDPLEQFCEGDPDADECRVHDN